MRSVLALLLVLVSAPQSAAACVFLQSSSFTAGYDSGTGTTGAVTAQTKIVSCTANQSVTLAMDMGLHSTTFASRQAQSGTSFVLYNVFTDATMTKILGDGTGGSSTETILVDGTGAGTFSSYFNIPNSQTPPVGTYTDTINETITF